MPKNVRKNTIWNGRDLRIEEIYWKDINGIIRKKEIAERTVGQNVVSAVAVTRKKEVILINEFRPSMGAEVIGLPGGKCDIPGEYVENTVRRELVEETGYEAEKMTKLFGGPVSPGLSPEYMTVYLAEGLKLTGGKIEDKIQVYEIPLDGFEEWFAGKERMGILVDVQARAYIEYARARLGMNGE